MGVERVTRTARIWIGNDQIVRKVFHENAEETLEDAKESWEIIKELSGGKKLPLLVDFTTLRLMEPSARAFYASHEAAQAVSACGGITRSLIGKVIGNFFIGFNKPPTPGRIFNSDEEALKWLKTFL